MDVAETFSSYPHQDSAFSSRASSSKSSGLTLVLPALKGGKVLVKGGKKRKNGPFTENEEQKKIPRPVKLKPLKEVLSKLISQIQKKDDYAFFLKPVDISQVAGYLDVVKRPMDFGTMAMKVSRGKYRSLEEFMSDIRLVTGNAKLFNPPGTIYYTEAERIEAWALDHIQRASATVIQYETDWNIDVEKDEDSAILNVEEDEDLNSSFRAHMDVDEGRRSPSVASQVQSGPNRRSARTVTKKVEKAEKPNVVAESVDSEGRLPGSRDGLGVFPPGSDWARTILALKLKGKRYKTKKERLQREKEGPPFLPDGSLDYAEMEDPFSVLSVFAPEPLTRPFLTPLYPPLFPRPPPSNSIPGSPLPHTPTPSEPQIQAAPLPPSSSSSITSTALPPHFTPSSNPPNHLLASGYTLGPPSADPPAPPPTSTTTTAPTPASKRRHWHLARSAPRAKLKDKDGLGDPDAGEGAEGPAWQVPREAHALDFGSYGALVGMLEAEMKRRGGVDSVLAPVNGNGVGVGAVKEGEEENRVVLEFVRESVECRMPEPEKVVEEDENPPVLDEGEAEGHATYWTDGQALEAERYLRDLVYGGVDGLAYVRSLAEFVGSEDQERLPCLELEGLTLARWVEREVVDDLTEGRHSLLRQAAIELGRARTRPDLKTKFDADDNDVTVQVWKSLSVYPPAALALAFLSALVNPSRKIDMAALIRKPEELFESEKEWVGKVFSERRRKKRRMLEGKGEKVKHEMRAGEEEKKGEGGCDDVATNGVKEEQVLEGPEELMEVMEYVADVIVELDRKIRNAGGGGGGGGDHEGGDRKVPEEEEGEDAVLRDLRLNLLALAKRAPLDTIARLPPDLVPAHIRQFVPILGS